MRLNRATALLLAVLMISAILTGCQGSSGDTVMSDSFEEAVEAGIAWDKLAAKADSPPCGGGCS